MGTQLNWMSLPRPKRETQTRTFVDGCDSSRKITLSLARLTVPGQARALERAQAFIEQYITDAEPYPMIGGQPAEITDLLIRHACAVEAMLSPTPDPGADVPSFHDLIAIAHQSDNIFPEIRAWAQEINGEFDPKSKAEADTAPPSGSVSTEGP